MDTQRKYAVEITAVEEAEIIPISKYAQKKLASKEMAQNAVKVRNNKAVSTEEKKLHKKVSRNLLLSLRNTQCTVVCDKTGIVSILNIPYIPGKVLTWASPLAELHNARGIAQEGYDYLNALDTQILSGIFITLSSEYDLVRTTPSATGAENNAILRTASKEKLIQGILLIESFIHSSNCQFLPRMSMIYDDVLKESGIEGRMTEWMRMVEEAIEKPDLEFYDENALLDKPMKGIKELKKEHSILIREQKRKASLKDPLFKERAQFRKDMKEAKVLVKSLQGNASQKLVSFLSQLFTEESYLTVDKALLGQVMDKVALIETASAIRLIAILATDRDNLRKEMTIDDLDDPLMGVVAEQSEAMASPTSNEQSEQQTSSEDKEHLQPFEGEFTAIRSVSEQGNNKPQMPEGLSFVEKVLWKKKYNV